MHKPRAKVNWIWHRSDLINYNFNIIVVNVVEVFNQYSENTLRDLHRVTIDYNENIIWWEYKKKCFQNIFRHSPQHEIDSSTCFQTHFHHRTREIKTHYLWFIIINTILTNYWRKWNNVFYLLSNFFNSILLSATIFSLFNWMASKILNKKTICLDFIF